MNQQICSDTITSAGVIYVVVAHQAHIPQIAAEILTLLTTAFRPTSMLYEKTQKVLSVWSTAGGVYDSIYYIIRYISILFY